MGVTESIHDLLDLLGSFFYSLCVSDPFWDIPFPDEANRWNNLHVRKCGETFYVALAYGDAETLEVGPKEGVRALDNPVAPSSSVLNRDQLDAVWLPIIRSVHKWLKIVSKDWVKANKRIWEEYPLRNRYGIIPHAVIRDSLPDACHLERELGRERTSEFVRLVEEGFFRSRENTDVLTMTAADYFEYCRIAYIAVLQCKGAFDASLSGREMYDRYADGRHEGLLDIDPDSEQEFVDWLDGTHSKKTDGGHPWEIKRGGNTTHIAMTVSRPFPYRNEGFRVELRAASTTKMADALRMFLAIREAGLPVSITHPETVRKRLLAQDDIGIVPFYASLHRANQHFRLSDDVFDVMHYDDLGRFKRRATPFITWEPLPILKPRST